MDSLASWARWVTRDPRGRMERYAALHFLRISSDRITAWSPGSGRNAGTSQPSGLSDHAALSSSSGEAADFAEAATHFLQVPAPPGAPAPGVHQEARAPLAYTPGEFEPLIAAAIAEAMKEDCSCAKQSSTTQVGPA